MAVSTTAPVVDGGRTSTRLIVGSPLRVERAEDAFSRPTLKPISPLRPVRSAELSLTGQKLVVEPGQRGRRSAERHRHASRAVVDDFGDVVAIQRRCASCMRWGVGRLGWCSMCAVWLKRRRRREDPETHNALGRERRRAQFERDPEAHKREKQRVAAAARARYERDPEAERARWRRNQQQRREQIRMDPVRYQRMLEDARIDRRLRREALGLAVGNGVRRVAGTPTRYGRAVPAAPLARLVEAECERIESETFAADAGVSERLLYAWRVGERRNATWDAADGVLGALDRFWWEVYDPTDAKPCDMFSGVRGRDVVAWIKAAEMAAGLWEPQPAIGERMSINRNTWRVESWDETAGVFWLRRITDGERASFLPERLEELL